MKMIKENIVKYGRLIIDISVLLELLCLVASVLIYFFVGLATLNGVGSFLLLLLTTILGAALGLVFIILFNYLIYLLIDIAGNLEKMANK